ncbi:lipoprotein [Rugosimonospora africana]|uniref:Lipoprotein n=1 Tax=Rugosimonospora africana TaxID=556532 RepID=A0A8J3QWW2_9ACTN|nr:lipoprotein [Rugosimonospora africana]
MTNPATPKRQFRAMWIATVQDLDWPNSTDEAASKAQFIHELDYAVSKNMNAVIVQVRPTADAFWPSPYEPWSGYLTGVRGKDPGWDPLAFMVDAAHARNLEFHAWFNPFRVSMPASSPTSTEAGGDIDKLAPGAPLRQHPDWAVVYPVGVPTQTRLYYNPGIPEVRDFVAKAIMDAVDRYDIDGVQFDDYYYPYPTNNQDFGDDATFARYGAGFADRADWRRHNIDVFIQQMHDDIHAAKPWVRFGVSPFGIWRNDTSDPLGSATAGTESYGANYADTRLWVKSGWIDYVAPQIYWNIGFTVADYAVLTAWWSDVVAGTNVDLYIGQANYKQGAAGQGPPWFDPAEISRHLTFNEAYPEVKGDIFFREQIVEQDPVGSTTRLVADHYSHPALIQPNDLVPAKPLLFPVVLGSSRLDTGAVTLRWRPTVSGQGPFGPVTSYAVYRFDGLTGPGACGLADGQHLIASQRAAGTGVQSWTDTTAQSGHEYTYYVTALDREWNESAASPPGFVGRHA